MRTARPVPLFALALLLPAAAFGQIVAQHLGANDPVAAGFSIFSPGDDDVGPVLNDQGLDAWSIRDDRVFDATKYRYFLTSEEAVLLANAPGAVLTTTMRFVEPGFANHRFTTGSRSFNFTIRLDPNGNIVVGLFERPIYILENGGTDYHTYDFAYDALDDVATLWINGSERVTGIVGSSTALQARLEFGNSSHQTHTHWNEVTLTIIPEPATAALLAGAGALLAVGILRRRRAKLFAVDPGQRVAG